MAVKNRLREIRMRDYMVNQKEFCEQILNLSVSTYNPIEQNKAQGNIETILKISKALNRPVEEIWYMVD